MKRHNTKSKAAAKSDENVQAPAAPAHFRLSATFCHPQNSRLLGPLYRLLYGPNRPLGESAGSREHRELVLEALHEVRDGLRSGQNWVWPVLADLLNVALVVRQTPAIQVPDARMPNAIEDNDSPDGVAFVSGDEALLFLSQFEHSLPEYESPPARGKRRWSKR